MFKHVTTLQRTAALSVLLTLASGQALAQP